MKVWRFFYFSFVRLFCAGIHLFVDDTWDPIFNRLETRSTERKVRNVYAVSMCMVLFARRCELNVEQFLEETAKRRISASYRWRQKKAVSLSQPTRWKRVLQPCWPLYTIMYYIQHFLILTYDYAIAMHICECKLDSINDMQHVVKVCMEKVNWTINSDSKT